MLKTDHKKASLCYSKFEVETRIFDIDLIFFNALNYPRGHLNHDRCVCNWNGLHTLWQAR